MKKKPPHKIRLTLEEDGTLTAKVTGINGPGCQGVTDWLAELGEVVENKPTAEFYRMTTASEKAGRTLTGGRW